MADRITLDTPLKFTAPGGQAYAGRGRWHLPQGDQPGEWMRDYKSRPILCEHGYHWCEARHAVHHLHAECYVIEPRGVTVRGDNKCVSQGGRLLRRVETWNERTARLFAADCAEAVVHLCGDDPRPRAAIDVARRFARGEASQEELAVARVAASDAAWVAARVARVAARVDDCVARVAARAARDAAWAASDAARVDDCAAWVAARVAARDAPTDRLLQYLNGEVE